MSLYSSPMRTKMPRWVSARGCNAKLGVAGQGHEVYWPGQLSERNLAETPTKRAFAWLADSANFESAEHA